MHRKKLTALLVSVTLVLFFFSANVFAEKNFDSDSDYDIYYEVAEYEINIVKAVKIIALIDIGDKKFLEISGSGFSGKEKKGYIRFENVKAILPSNHIIAERVSSKK